MKTLNEIRADLESNSTFLNLLSAKVFNRRVSIDEMLKWVENNPAEFEAYSGVKIGEKKEAVTLTRENAKSVKAHLEAYAGKGEISVRRRGKYKLEIMATSFSTSELQRILKECGYKITKSLTGKFGSTNDWLLHIVCPI